MTMVSQPISSTKLASNPPLQNLYAAARAQLRQTYTAQERNESISTLDLPIPTTSEDADLQEIPTDLLLSNAQGILSAPDFVNSAQYAQRLAQAYRQVIAVFEDNDRTAWQWLHHPNRALGDVMPADLLTTDAGAEQVNTLLGRIEYGVYS